MTKFVVHGPTTLNGTVVVGGSKNAALKILAGTLLATKPVTLHNVPAISDVAVMIEILKGFGMKIDGTSGTVTLDPSELRASDVPDELAKSLRASIVVLGPAVARFGNVSMIHPGGDVIGRRPLDTHFEALGELGVKFEHTDRHYQATTIGLQGAEIFLSEASVTATENAMMAAVTAKGTTIIHNSASELHTTDLAEFLVTLGAQIEGAGTNRLVIHGVEKLGGGEHTVRPDETEAATLMIAAAVCGGEVTLAHVDPQNFGLILKKLREAGLNFTCTDTTIEVKGPHDLRAVPKVHTNVWPGFPSDLVSPFTVLMTQAKGMSLLHDWMYEGRFFYTDKLVSMGANITLADPHRIIVSGPTKLVGKELASPDLRAGMTMLVAALIAEGETVIDHAEHIDRGYECIDERLRALGATISRVE